MAEIPKTKTPQSQEHLYDSSHPDGWQHNDVVYNEYGEPFFATDVEAAYGSSASYETQSEPEYIPSPDGYGFVPKNTAGNYSQQPEVNNYADINDKINAAANTAKAVIISGSAIAGSTAVLAPDTFRQTVETAQNIYENAPGPAAIALGSLALTVVAGYQTVKNLKRRRREKSKDPLTRGH